MIDPETALALARARQLDEIEPKIDEELVMAAVRNWWPCSVGAWSASGVPYPDRLVEEVGMRYRGMGWRVEVAEDPRQGYLILRFARPESAPQ